MIGLAAGLLVLGRRVLELVVPARFLLDALGVSPVLTGTLRLAGAFEVDRRTWHLLSLPGARFCDQGTRVLAITRIGPEHRKRGRIRQLEALGYKVTRTRSVTGQITSWLANARGGLRAAGRR